MGDPHGFLKVQRGKEKERATSERVFDYREFSVPPPLDELKLQASRCMECGIPFCHSGCPLGNLIPEWNDFVYRGRMDRAAQSLLSTNNFPEFTGRVCPAPCETSCTLNLQNAPVSIKMIEKNIAEHILGEGLAPVVTRRRTGRKVAVVGSGPAGLAAAQQLARAGHEVTLFERDDRFGGLLRYGIPDFKLEKALIDRRIEQLEAEGVELRPGTHVGVDVTGDDLREQFDAIALTGGAREPRNLPVPGRELVGVHFAMQFLEQQNRRVAGDRVDEAAAILATGKRVVVIGGGDTGSDCVGTSNRQGATSVTQVEILPKPPLMRPPVNPWPEWPQVLRTSSSHEEGCARDWAIQTKRFVGDNGHVVGLEAVRVERAGNVFRPVEGSDFVLPCDLALLAMGFLGPEKPGLLEQLGVALDARGNVVTTPNGATNIQGVFAAGDMARGQSLVVWAIADGRRVAEGIDAFLGQGDESESAA